MVRKIIKKINNSLLAKDNVIDQAVDDLVNFTKPTLGPNIRHILIDREYENEMVDDGVTIARDYESQDELKNAVIKFVKEAARRTNEIAGDGTTTSLVLLQSILRNIRSSEMDINEALDDVESGADIAVQALQSIAEQVETKEDLQSVIETASLEDASDLADILWENRDGVITVETYSGTELYAEKQEGMQWEGGYVSSFMVNNPERFSWEAEDVHVLLSRQKIENVNDIENVVDELQRAGKMKLLIVAHGYDPAIIPFFAHAWQKGFQICAVRSPFVSDQRDNALDDLGVITEGKVASSSLSTPLSEMHAVDVGTIGKAVVTKFGTTLYGGNANQQKLQERVEQIETELSETDSPYEEDRLKERLSFLTEGIVVLRVGGYTDSEIAARRYKVEDAVNSAQSALEAGMIAGAGAELSRLETGSTLLDNALQAPLRTICENASIDVPKLGAGETIDVLTGKTGPYKEIGVIDTAKTAQSAIENAVSIAKLLLRTAGIITNEYEDSDGEVDSRRTRQAPNAQG